MLRTRQILQVLLIAALATLGLWALTMLFGDVMSHLALILSIGTVVTGSIVMFLVKASTWAARSIGAGTSGRPATPVAACDAQ